MDERKEAFMWFCSCDVPEAGKPGADGPEMEAAEGRRPRQEACHTRPLDVVVTTRDFWVLQPYPLVFQS